MAARSHLRVAEPAEAPKRKTVAQAAESGTHRELLVAMRDRIAKTVTDPDCPPRELAALSRRLQDIVKDIRDLDLAESEEQSVVVTTADESWDPSSI